MFPPFLALAASLRSITGGLARTGGAGSSLGSYDEDMPVFARDEAEQILPKVRPYVEDIQRRKAIFDDRPSEPLAAEIRALIGHVAEMGVEVKDLDLGLIDFPSVRRGRQIYLCWKLGEGDTISWWHEVNTGYAGRRPIKELYEN
jgi:hypothetical protein